MEVLQNVIIVHYLRPIAHLQTRARVATQIRNRYSPIASEGNNWEHDRSVFPRPLESWLISVCQAAAVYLNSIELVLGPPIAGIGRSRARIGLGIDGLFRLGSQE